MTTGIGLGIWRRRRALSGGGPPPLPAGTLLATLSDSGYARQNIYSATTSFNTSGGPTYWLNALMRQRSRYFNWYDASATTANLVPTYAEASATNPLWRGLNFGLSGDTTTGMRRRVAQVIASNAKLCILRGGSNVGAGDNPVGVVTGNLQWIIGQLVAGGVRVIIETILPRRVSLTPTGFELTPAEMARILTINDAIRANWAAWGAADIIDPFDTLRDPAFPPGDQLYGNGLPAYFIADGAHVSALGGYVLAKFQRPIIERHIEAGRWFTQNAGGLVSNWNLTGSSGTVGGSCTGQMPTGFSILNTNGAGQPVTAACALSANAETGGQTLTITVSSTGAGAANTFQELRIANTAITAGLVSTNWHQFVPDFEVDNASGVLGLWQTKLGEGSVVSARGLGQMGWTSGGTANEYYPAENGMRFEPDTAPLDVGARVNMVGWLSLFGRLDVAGTATVRLHRWRMPQINNPSLDAPWVP